MRDDAVLRRALPLGRGLGRNHMMSVGFTFIVKTLLYNTFDTVYTIKDVLYSLFMYVYVVQATTNLNFYSDK